MVIRKELFFAYPEESLFRQFEKIAVSRSWKNSELANPEATLFHQSGRVPKSPIRKDLISPIRFDLGLVSIQKNLDFAKLEGLLISPIPKGPCFANPERAQFANPKMSRKHKPGNVSNC